MNLLRYEKDKQIENNKLKAEETFLEQNRKQMATKLKVQEIFLD